jgi:hypothetical protein
VEGLDRVRERFGVCLKVYSTYSCADGHCKVDYTRYAPR